MLQKELRQHQWKAFRRNPMFERNLGVRIFMYIMFGFLALEFLAFGFVFDKLLLEAGTYTLAIDVFNSVILYVLAADFAIKFLFKQNQSMQIAPYLSLPVKRNRLFDFLLRKEFSNMWNLYLLFLVLPFAFKSITPFFGFGAAVLYILFFYLLCIANSLIVSIVNNLVKKSVWFYIVATAIVVLPFAFPLLLKIDLGIYTRQAGDWLLNYNLLLLSGFILLFAALWIINRLQMREDVYRELQGEKINKISSFSSFSFLERFGELGEFINLELKMLTRSKRLKSQLYFAIPFFFVYFFWQMYSSNGIFQHSFPAFLFFGIFLVSALGLVMGQYLFMAESAHFDGLMSRKLSILSLLKGKYFLYSFYSLLVTFTLLVPVFSGKLSLLLVISILFFVTGPIYFLIFQNAVYNKTYFDLFDGGMMNWKGTSGNMLVITMVTMFIPLIILAIINALFSQTIASYFMLTTGLLFTFTSQYWLEWTYKRFLKRKYKNMEGFRSNA
jgi:hypothetical protein